MSRRVHLCVSVRGAPPRRVLALDLLEHVGEEYPCSLCIAENSRRRQERAEYDRAMREQEAAHYARMFGDAELDSWLLPSSSSGANE